MVTEMITLKLEEKFLEDIDSAVKKEGYQSRTEFIRNAVRQKLEDSKLKESMASLAHLKGSAKKNVSEKEYEQNRQNAFMELFKKLR
jgi:metal-responsive CopG/Arc/MetJ family transcriptional regulator